MDHIFDGLNLKTKKEGECYRNDFLKPHTTEIDSRFDWLENTLLPFFSN